MSFGYHITNGDDLRETPPPSVDLATLYTQAEAPFYNWANPLPLRWERIYFGDEFCIKRLPDLARMAEILSLCRRLAVHPTLLTPSLSDFGLDTITPLLNLLAAEAPTAEVVANDWGMVLFLKKNYPSLHISIVRLLNKGFKDPRIPEADIGTVTSNLMFQVSSFDFSAFHRKARSFGVTRLERDLLPYATELPPITPEMETSIYFPFGFITTGRVCRISTLTGSETDHFAVTDRCAMACETISFKKGRTRAPLTLIEAGNTIYYLYPPDRCEALLNWATAGKGRLVFQNVIGTPRGVK
jgi:hypothetical protein